MNKTVTILLDLLMKFQAGRRRMDPAWRTLEKQREDLYQAFLRRHAGNHRLIRQVNDLLDAETAAGEHQSDQSFLLGVQLGLELGSVDPLGDWLEDCPHPLSGHILS